MSHLNSIADLDQAQLISAGLAHMSMEIWQIWRLPHLEQPNSYLSVCWLLIGVMEVTGPGIFHHLAIYLGLVHILLGRFQGREEWSKPLKTQAWNWNMDSSGTFCFPKQVKRLVQIQGIGKWNLSLAGGVDHTAKGHA